MGCCLSCCLFCSSSVGRFSWLAVMFNNLLRQSMPQYFFWTIFCYGWGMLGPCSSQTTDGWCVIWCFQGVLYAFIYFSTDQYIPSLPAMQLELGGSQGFMTGTLVAAATVATVLPLMNIFFADIFFRFIFISFHIQWWYQRRNQDGMVVSCGISHQLISSPKNCRGAVQMNLCVKAISGMLTAGLSDRVGRRPVLVMCHWAAFSEGVVEFWVQPGGKWVSRADEERIEKTKTIKPLDITSHCISKLSGGLIT